MERAATAARRQELESQERSYPGRVIHRSRLWKEKALQGKEGKSNGKEIEYTEKQKAHMDKDGTFTAKHNAMHFGYKLHQKTDIDHGLIREYSVTTASSHDSKTDLTEIFDKAVYRDRGYSGVAPHPGIKDMTMKKGARGRPLTREEKKYNKTIAKVRAPGERPFSVLQRVFHDGRTRVKNLSRVTVQGAFDCIAYNLYHLFTLRKQRKW